MSLNLSVHFLTRSYSQVSKEKAGPILVVDCACGIAMKGTIDVLVPMVIKHARDSHNMNVTRENVLSRARPEA
jgi:predicted small metal-binding protein